MPTPDHDTGTWLERARANAAAVRTATAPNPWVGAVLITEHGSVFDGATEPPGGRHAEIVALDATRAGGHTTEGATVVVTLEPCNHTGRTPPCTEALITAGVSRVIIGLVDPDPQVAGTGIQRLRRAGIEVDVIDDAACHHQLTPYLHHRRTGRPFVVLKLAATLDGRTAAPDGTSRWITGPEARADVHRLRSESDAILVGAGTIRADDPELTVRAVAGPSPRRLVLGAAPPQARVRPCEELSGELEEILDRLGGQGVLQLMVEGGPTVAGAFHRAGLVDHYVIYLAPALLGGNEAFPLLGGPGVPTMADAWRGRILDITRLGEDLRLDLRPIAAG